MTIRRRIMLIQHIFAAENRVVEYVYLATICPVCEFLGLPPGRVEVDRTAGTLRYCTCKQCTASFRAIGASNKENEEKKEHDNQIAEAIEADIKKQKAIKKSNKKKKKR
jgi:hypothetical protein